MNHYTRPTIISPTGDFAYRVLMSVEMASVAMIPKDAEFEGRPWEQQVKWGEGTQAFQAFQFFRDQGMDRTVKEASRLYRVARGLQLYDGSVPGRKPRQDPMVYKWSAQFRWMDRAAAFDAFMDAKELETIRRRRLSIARKQADDAAALQEAMVHPIKKYQERLAKMLSTGSPDELDQLSDEELLRLAKDVAKSLVDAQKAERDALMVNDHQDGAGDLGQTAIRGTILRKLLATPQAIGMAEEINFAVTNETTKTIDEAQSG